MALVLPNPSLGTGVIDPTPIEENFTEIASKFGNITTADLSSSAGITTSQLAASYEWVIVSLSVRGALSSTGPQDFVPIYNDGKGAWTVAAAYWISPDIGAETGKFKVQYGYYDATGTWTASSSSDEMTITDAGAITAGYQTAVTGMPSTITGVTHNPNTTWIRSLALNITTADATATGLFVSVLLKRQITGA